VEAASLVIAEVNPHVPVVHGDGFLPASRIDAWVATERPVIDVSPEPLDEVALEIGRNVATLVEDGSTLQLGIGVIPDATLKALRHKKDLGVWTEMFSDGVIELIDNGNITGRRKTDEPGKITSSFTFGSERLYRYVDRNPLFVFHPSDLVNDPVRVARQHKMVAINSALQIDLTGQVCADSIGTRFYSGIGGQVDFIRGASMCPGGKPIIALRSTAKGGTLSRLVGTLEPGAGVVTSRGDVAFVVTEHGIANLHGKTVRERALALISVAHPDFRGELLGEAKKRRFVFADQTTPVRRYPRQYEHELRTFDGRKLRVRPVRLTDEARVRELLYAAAEDELYSLWTKAVGTTVHDQLKLYLRIDYHQSMTVVAESNVADQEPALVAAARYDVESDGRAEVAAVVHPEWRDRGIGTHLLQQLAGIAQEHELAALTTVVPRENVPLLHLMHKAGLEVRSTLDGDVYRLEIPLQP
jgi:ribosomal protein S18 acetylase RimI-like enzyme/acyl CoA:acetate/3-ketoacid CoA transferase beta subunit